MMSKRLNREFTVKRKVWQIILEGFLNAVIVTFVLYMFFQKCDDEIIKVLTWIKEESMAFRAAMVFFPLLLIVMTITKIAYFVYGSVEPTKKKKNN